MGGHSAQFTAGREAHWRLRAMATRGVLRLQVTVTVGTTLFALSFIFADSAKNVGPCFLLPWFS